MAGGAIEVDVKPDMAGFTSKLKSGLQGAASGVAGVASKAFSVITTAAKTALAGAAVFAGAALVTGFKRITAIQDATASLTTIMGSAAKAGDFMGEILKTVQGTPFNLDQFATAGKNLVAFGANAQKVPGYLTAIGNAAAASGRGAEAVDQIVDALGKASAQGKITGETIQSLAAQGVPALQILANKFGVTTDEMKKMISDGAVPAEAAIDALTEGIMTGTDGAAGATVAFGGAMEGLRQTFTGAWGGMKASVARFGAAFIGPFLDQMTGGVNGFSNLLDKLAPTVQAWAGKASAQLAEFGRSAKEAFSQFTLGFTGSDAASGFFGKIGAQASDLVAKLKPLGAAFKDALGDKVQSAGKIITGVLAPALGALASIAGGLAEPLGRVAKVLSQAFGAGIEAAAGAIKTFTANSSGFASAATAIANSVAGIAENLLPLVKGGFSALGGGVQIALTVLDKLLGVLKPLEPVLTAVGTAAAFAFGAFKIGGAITSVAVSAGEKLSGMFLNLRDRAQAGAIAASGSADAVSGMGEKFAGAASKTEKVTSVISKAGVAIPIVGLAFGLLASQWAEDAERAEALSQKSHDLADALAQGGKAAADAKTELKQIGQASEDYGKKADALNKSVAAGNVQHEFQATLYGKVSKEQAKVAKDAEKYAAQQIAAMTPVELAQKKVNDATYAYGQALKGNDPSKLAAAQTTLAGASEDLASKQKDLSDATQTATQKMAEQAAQALAAVDANLGYAQAQLTAKQAVQEANAVLADGASTADQRAQAEINLTAAFVNVASAAATKAAADNAGKSQADIATASALAQNQAMLDLAASAGTAVPAGMAATIAANNQTIASNQLTKGAFDLVSASIVAVPNSKTVIISDNSPETIAKLQALGYKVTTLPDGTIQVEANTGPAEAAANGTVDSINSKTATITVFQKVVGVTGTSTAKAMGDIVEPFANGGIRALKKMSTGVAAMVQPNTWRVVGDRPRDPEAYIPIDRNSARSKMLLEETARRMGAKLAWYATGGISSSSLSGGSRTIATTQQITNNLYEVSNPVATANATVRRLSALGKV